MRILLTGGSGLVGSNIKENSRFESHELITPSSSELNLLDTQSVRKYINNYRPNLVIHAAGKVGGIQANMQSPVEFLVDNLEMGKNLILASREANVRNFLNIGSSCMYPKGYDQPLQEEQILSGPLEPTNEGYALAKIMCQRLCDYVSHSADFLYKTIVPCNIYGRFDSFSSSKSHLVPAIISKIHNAIISDIDVVEIWGDGLARREFMYAGDLADCIYECIERYDTLPSLMNVGTGVDHSINEYYTHVANIIGYKGSYSHDASRPVGMARKIVSIERQLKWGWKASTSLADGISQTYNYFLQIQDK